MKISFLPAARAELDAAFVWYEEQAVGLGYEFLDEFDRSLRLISSFPRLHSFAGKGIRRCLLNRFPYGIFFGIADEMIVIAAVAHLKRKPGYWSPRTGPPPDED